ncbi:unnamed protein product, partial [Musa textilis]
VILHGLKTSYYLFQVCSLWRLHRHIHLLLLHILLSREIRHVGLHANINLLWLHDLHLLWILPYAGDCQFLCLFALRVAYILGHRIEDIHREATATTSTTTTTTFTTNCCCGI